MHVDENFNVVFPVVTERVTRKEKGDDGKEKDVHEDIVRIHAFHTPISKAVFEQHFRMLAATKAVLEAKGLAYMVSVGSRIAALLLRDEGLRDAESRGRFDSNGNPQSDEVDAFFAELRRLTMILCPGPNGWEMLPVDLAISGGKIDQEDWEEVLSSIVFFTCHWSLTKKARRASIAESAASHLKGLITSLPLSAYLASLPNLTQAGISSARAVSSVPS